MKRILSGFLAVLMMTACGTCLQIGGAAADERTLWATVSNGNTHLLPGDYAKAVKDFGRGKMVENFTYSDWA